MRQGGRKRGSGRGEDEMEALTFEKIQKARERIRPFLQVTPLEKSIYLSAEGRNVFLKLECQQPVRSFKIRGALNKILSLSDEARQEGVAAVSSGNHGIAVAYVTKLLGMKPATVIVPENTPDSKLEKIRYYGANVLLMGNCYDEAASQGMAYIREKGYRFIDGGDEDAEVYAGQGTVGMEIMEQNPDIDTILAPIGGGGLVTGIAVAAKSVNPKVRVIPVCTESCSAWMDSVREQRLYHEYPSRESICEAMVGGIGKLSYSMRGWIDEAVTVREETIRRAMLHAIWKEKIVAEAAGATPIAAILQHGNRIGGENIALVVSGGNADNRILVEEFQRLKL